LSHERAAGETARSALMAVEQVAVQQKSGN
jgi:hypothetical protein